MAKIEKKNWFIERQGNAVFGNGYKTICRFDYAECIDDNGIFFAENGSEALENMYLISASLDMFDALIAVIKTNEFCNCGETLVIKQAKEAIAKARGEINWDD